LARLAKFLKPFIYFIILAVVLLAVQAYCDLSLPSYMSNIVNNGIQQGGIVNSVPEAIRKNSMEKALIFLGEEEQTAVLESYFLPDQTSPDFSTLVKTYPLLKDEPVYLLKKNLSEEELNALNPVMGKALLATAGIEQMLKDRDKGSMPENTLGFDLSMVPSGITSDQFFSLLSQLPQERLASLRSGINGSFKNIGESMANQMAAGTIRAEYEAVGMDTSALQNRYIWRTGLFMLLLSLLSAAATTGVGYFAARTAAGTARNVRKKLFEKVTSFSGIEFDKFSTASLITRTTNDITQVQMVVVILIRIIFYAPIMGIGGTILALQKSTHMSWIIAVAVVVLLGIILVIFSIALPKFKKIQGLLDRLNLVMRENLSGMMVVRAFNRQKFEEDRFDRANQDLTATNLFVNRLMVIMMPAMMLIMNGLTLLIVWVGAHQVARSSMQVGDMLAFMQYAMLIVIAFLMLSIMFIMVPRASISAARVAEVLGTEISIKDPQLSFKADPLHEAASQAGFGLAAEPGIAISPAPAAPAGLPAVAIAVIPDPEPGINEAAADAVPDVAAANTLPEAAGTGLIPGRPGYKGLKEIQDKKGKGIIEFRDVSFRYPGADVDVLQKINFSAMPGMTTAIIGATGSGKSTLVNLIPRFYDVTSGAVYIDGKDVRHLSQHVLRSKIGYVPQKSLLFSGTIESNLKYADEDASLERMQKAVEAAQAIDFINEKPEGFTSSISQKGANVSGGQNQRLSIARALVRDSLVYIFDDCFSALDFKTDAALRKALKSYIKERTVIMVAQRVGTVMNADQIIVLEEGRIAGVGTHMELLKSCGTYQEIALSQLSMEELS
jgi:ABC-type multidrug transport system fused ATPase/permease subunit